MIILDDSFKSHKGPQTDDEKSAFNTGWNGGELSESDSLNDRLVLCFNAGLDSRSEFERESHWTHLNGHKF